MKTELFAAAGLAGLFALTGAGNGNSSPPLTTAQKEQLVVHATCQKLNDKFLGTHDIYAKTRVKGCVMTIDALKAVLK